MFYVSNCPKLRFGGDCSWSIMTAHRMRRLQLLFLLLTSGLRLGGICGSHAYLFSLLLSNPVVAPDDPDSASLAINSTVDETHQLWKTSDDSDVPSDVRVQTSSPTAGSGWRSSKRNRGDRDVAMRLAQSHSLDPAKESRTKHHDLSLQLTIQVSSDRVCASHAQCSKGRFCQQPEGVCWRKVRLGGYCSQDVMCRGRAKCRRGICSRHAAALSHSVECQTSADCGQNECCARQSGASVCKQLTKRGERCINQPAFLGVPIYDICPCEARTRCKYIHRPGETWSLWKAYDNLRCVAHSEEKN